MPNALIYCRVSTEEQAEQGYSLDAQERLCRDYAKNNGYRCLDVYRDEGRSGTNLNRPALQAAMERIRAGGSVDAVLVQETDRLARNTNDHFAVKAVLRKAGVRLISVAQPMLDDTPEGMLVDTMLASINQFQSDINSRKTKKGLEQRFLSGWYPAWAPVGYMNNRQENATELILPDPKHWDLVHRALTLYLSGEYTVLALRDQLHAEGLRTRLGGKVAHSSLCRVLQNPFYAGIMVWNGVRKPGRHKPMITLGEHERILTILRAHNLGRSRRRIHEFLLSGFAYCNICKGRYIGERHADRGNIGYYRCNLHGAGQIGKTHGNKGQNVEVSDLERQVEARFKQIQFSQRFVDDVTQRLTELYEDQRQEIDTKKQALLNERSGLEHRREVAERKLLRGVLGDDDFVRIKTGIQAALDGIGDQLDELELERAIDVNVIREVLLLARDAYDAYQKTPFEVKRRLLALFWDKFLIQNRKIVEAVPARLIRDLVDREAVRLRPVWGPSPALTRTIQDWKYMAQLREDLDGLKALMASAAGEPDLARSRAAA